MSDAEQFFNAIKEGKRDDLERLVAVNPQLLEARYEGYLSPCLLALYYNEPELASWLFEQGIPLDIFSAAAIAPAPVLEEILDNHPDLLNAFAKDGFQPLGLAAFFGNLEAVGILLERGAQVNQPSQNAMRVMPLHSAVANRHLEIARLLIARGALVNATQANDFTPLHAAAQNGQLGMVLLLLENGAQTGAVTGEGETPLKLALIHGHQEVAAVLQTQPPS